MSYGYAADEDDYDDYDDGYFVRDEAVSLFHLIKLKFLSELSYKNEYK